MKLKNLIKQLQRYEKINPNLQVRCWGSANNSVQSIALEPAKYLESRGRDTRGCAGKDVIIIWG